MKKLFLAAGMIAALSSCKKEMTPAPELPAEKKLIRTVSVYDGTDAGTTTITYDARGRMSAFKRDNYTDYFAYETPASFKVTERKNSDNSILQTKECTLDAAGRITRIVFKNTSGVQTYSMDYVYNADGRLVKRTGSNGSSISEFSLLITGGNVTGYTMVNDGVLSFTGEIKRNAQLTNKEAWVNGAYWPSPTWFGKRSQNLVAELKVINAAGALTYHAQSTYILDADGYPVSVNISYLLEGKQGTDTHTYE